ncbi:MAG: hypothetical protein JRI45_04175 [Deltaproteobacteria bacterium]|nr:hypothetical protein [Deltaproteobacteria bacterium]MBW2068537.1 hypothetical protein [Deltaproteobacteria bacterium]
MTWYKTRISRLIKGKEKDAPYCYWSNDIFAKILPKLIPKDLDRVLSDVAIIIGTWERVLETARLWSDGNTLNAVRRGYVLTMMFFCLQYPRETILDTLIKNLPAKSRERKLCESLMHKDSDYRHIRNSIAHGSFEITEDGKAIIFKDRKWKGQKLLAEVELDSLIVFDILMSAFEAKLGRIAEQNALPDRYSAGAS